MKIGIEGQQLFRGTKHGMDMVALELIRNLQIIDQENEYVIFIKPDVDDTCLKESDRFRIVRLEGGFYPWWEQITLPRAAKAAGCQILHCTSNSGPVNTSIPIVVTLHDIIYMERSYRNILGGKGTTYQKIGNVYRRMIVPKIIQKSRKIITVSYFEKERIGEFFGIRGDSRLTAVYNGVSAHFKPVTDARVCQQIKAKYNLPDRFFLFLANTDPKKNTKGTVKAYNDFVKQTGSDIKLVMLDYDRAELYKLLIGIVNNSLNARIVLPGYVPNSDLPALYSQCEIFLYPSLRESFGIPILEAMACGVPVITSNTSSMPEVAGDAAFIINPYKPEEITEAMIRLTSNDLLKNSFITKGFVQAAKFSWKAMAENVLDIYRNTVV